MKNISIHKKLDNGSKVEIDVGYSSSKGSLVINGLGIIPKGKRKMIYIGNSQLIDQYRYRSLSLENREKMLFKLYVHLVGQHILDEALEKAWETLKPKPITKDSYDIDVDVTKIYSF